MAVRTLPILFNSITLNLSFKVISEKSKHPNPYLLVEYAGG